MTDIAIFRPIRLGVWSSDLITVLALLALSNSASNSTTSGCYYSPSTVQSLTTTTSDTAKYTVVDTNQTTCYNQTTGATEACSGTGYDADYTRNAPSYTKSGDGTVITDNKTGLMWTQSSDTNGDGSITVADKMYQSSAVSYCENLVVGGYSDWRLPDVKTLYSLMYFSGTDASSATGCSTAGDTSCNTSAFVHFLDTTYFDKATGDISAGERGIDGQYATTSNYAYYTNLANGNNETMFGVNFVDGRIKGYPCSSNVSTNTYFVRCVRGNTSYGLNNFTDNSNGTITDNATSLMWQKAENSSTNFDNAVSYCEGLSLASHTDWRLPNAKELHSIVDYTRSPDTSSSAAINSIFTTTSFTNEAGATDYAYYWTSSTHLDSNGNGVAGVYLSFGRAPGNVNGSIYDVHGAGAQRSNQKTNVASTSGANSATGATGTYYYKGPQVDILRNANRVRCVRN